MVETVERSGRMRCKLALIVRGVSTVQVRRRGPLAGGPPSAAGVIRPCASRRASGILCTFDAGTRTACSGRRCAAMCGSACAAAARVPRRCDTGGPMTTARHGRAQDETVRAHRAKARRRRAARGVSA